MSRLLTMGCSYTFYKWPTWADYLAGNFSEYCNKGIPGSDNATIARLITASANPGDIVVAMWTAYERYNHRIKYNSLYNWGEGVHIGIANIHNKEYFVNVYNQFERFVTSVDYLQWAISDSKLRNYTLINLAAFPYISGGLNSPVTDDMQKFITEKQWFIDQLDCADLDTFSHSYRSLPTDFHPTPLAHYDYANTVIAPKLGIKLHTDRSTAIFDNSTIQ